MLSWLYLKALLYFKILWTYKLGHMFIMSYNSFASFLLHEDLGRKLSEGRPCQKFLRLYSGPTNLSPRGLKHKHTHTHNTHKSCVLSRHGLSYPKSEPLVKFPLDFMGYENSHSKMFWPTVRFIIYII